MANNTDILQKLSIEFSSFIKKYVSDLKKLDAKDKKKILDSISKFKNSLDTLSENKIESITKTQISSLIESEYNYKMIDDILNKNDK